MKELKETAALMESADYRERFAAEYYQNETRYLKLKAMTEKWDNGTLEFSPTCPRELYNRQLSAMLTTIEVLVIRAGMENVELVIDEQMENILNQNRGNQVIMSKQVRIDIDNILHKVHNMEPCREISLVITKLQEGIMWMGMNLKRLREADPYPNSRNTNNEKIESTADGLKF